MPARRALADLPALLAGAREIYVSGCSAEPAGLPDRLREAGGIDATFTGIFVSGLNRNDYTQAGADARCRTFFRTAALRAAGRIDYRPWRYAEIDRWLGMPRRFDAAIAMIAPPDEAGLCSFGTQTDFLPSFHAGVGHLIGLINPRMPRTGGEPGIPYAAFEAAIDFDAPLLTAEPADPDPIVAAIARYAANLVPDGATVQYGIGKLPVAVAAALGSHRALKVHSGLIDDAVLRLDLAAPIVCGVAIGSPDLYATLDRRFQFRPAKHTHNYAVIAAIERFVGINGAVQVDLFGQVDAETVDGRPVSGPGGLPDFVRGALASPGGRSIVAVSANRIVPRVAMASVGKTDADCVVTEHGAACLRDLGMDERAEALIAIADPGRRDALAAAWDAWRRGAIPAN